MKLALDAIKESGNGDTTLVDYDVSTFESGKPKLTRAVSQKILERSVGNLRQRKE